MVSIKFSNENDEMKGLAISFLKSKAIRGANGFNEDFLSQFKFDSNGHPRWDFTYLDDREFNDSDWSSLVSLNLAWDCYFEGCCKI